MSPRRWYVRDDRFVSPTKRDSGLPVTARCSSAGVASVTFAVALAACGSDSTPAEQQRSAIGDRLSPQELVRQVQRSTVSIVTQPPAESRTPSAHGAHAHGSGVIWDADSGLVLTSDHLVENAGKIDVVVAGDTQVQGKLVARAQCNDVAVLTLHPKPAGLIAIDVANSSTLEIGEDVTAVGYLKSATATEASPIATHGAVASFNVSAEVSPDLPPLPSVVLHQASMKDQMSGGPLVNARGELVGLLTLVPGKRIAGPDAAVSSDYLKSEMAKLEEQRSGTFIGWKGQHACHRAMLKIANRVLVRHGPPEEHDDH
jgi:S1-C subfamily serine protease